jgi:hypothetical protein
MKKEEIEYGKEEIKKNEKENVRLCTRKSNGG